jgi:putative tryptophan/tyrosine transport system substrate-binding protein
MRRREFITLIGGATISYPLIARAQRGERIRTIGALLGIAEGNPEGQLWLAAFRHGLAEEGWIEGKNIRLLVRWPASDTGLMLRQARELLDEHCELIITHASPATLALRQTAPDVANIFVAVIDPIASGFVESIAHPGGNSTGFTNFEAAMGGKWVELLKEIAPACTNVVIALNPKTFPGGFESSHVRAIQAAAALFGMSDSKLSFQNADEIESGFRSIDQVSLSGLVVMPDTSTTQYSKLIVSWAERRRIAAIYPYRDFVNSGGLMCYGVDRSDLYRRAAGYVDRILRGDTPSQLPVQTPTKFEFVINLKTAKMLGLEVSPTLLATADEVLE